MKKLGLVLSLMVGCSTPPPPEPKDSPMPETASTELAHFPSPESPGADPTSYAHLPVFGFGREATEEEIAAWDIDVMPDGTGLPEGRGTVARGKELYDHQCVQCHGTTGQGADYDALVAPRPEEGFPFGRDRSLERTVGNYWPYATTLYDYTYRAMPQAVPGSLPPDDVYSLVAYVLYLNDIVAEDAVLDQDSLPRVVMPARDRFVIDNRRGGPEVR